MVNGVVSKIVERPYGNKTMYSLVFANDNIFYGFATNKPKCLIGDFVEFEASKNDRGYWQGDKDTLKVTKNENKVTGGNGSTSAISFTGPKDAYWAAKEKRDIENDKLRSLGAARNTAIEWVKFLIEKEALPMAKTVAKREEGLNAVLDDYTRLFMSGTLPVAVDSEVTPATEKKAKPAVMPDVTSDEAWS